MTTTTSAAAEEDVAAAADPAGFAQALAQLAVGLMRNPGPTLQVATRFTANLTRAGAEATARALGWEGQPARTPEPGDRRFSDPSFDNNPWFLGLRSAYLAWSECVGELAGASGLDDATAGKAAFALDQMVDALAPTNFLWGNPAALRRAGETNGASVKAGLTNFLDDVTDNGGRPRQVDSSAFEVGRNLACTPGKVVFRNDLIELIQYAPRTKSVFEVPLLLSPPWINRFYIMDLAPGRSFVEWAVDQGHTTFAISYRNPDESMRHLALDDYLEDGLGRAVQVVREITGSEQVNVAGLCVGGTLAVMLGAYLAQGGDQSLRSVTLLNTLVDFSEPGPLSAFTDAGAVARVEQRMAEQGYLDGREMATTFDSLRANDLIWNYVGTSWLMGEPPPAFDILAWNADPTRLPEATHSSYLRSFYLHNRLARGTMSVAGRPLRLKDIAADTYVLAAEKDHITPWKASYATTGLLEAAPIRFVLTSAGHIAGIVNPPPPPPTEGQKKAGRTYWTNGNGHLPPEPEAWMAGAVEHQGSWWEDWASWIEARAGNRRRPPAKAGSKAHPALDDAPGTYVHE